MSVSLPSGSTSIVLNEKDEERPTTNENEHAGEHKNTDTHEQETPLEAAVTRQAILAIPGVTADLEANNIYIVGWDGSDDKTNPLNGTPFCRWGTICLVSLITLITYVPSHPSRTTTPSSQLTCPDHSPPQCSHPLSLPS
jgi:hypothetical protein